MFVTKVDLEKNHKLTDSKDAVASKFPPKKVIIFGASAAALALLLIIFGVVFSRDDTPKPTTLLTYASTVAAPTGATVKTHTQALPLPAQAVVFSEKYFVPLVASASFLVLAVVAVVVAAVLLKGEESVAVREDPDPNWHVRPDEWVENPEEPFSVGTLIGIAAGVVVAVLLLAVGVPRVVASCRARPGPTPRQPALAPQPAPEPAAAPPPGLDTIHIDRGPDEALPTAEVCLERFQTVMRWVADKTIKIRPGLSEGTITVTDNGTYVIPDTMNGYNLADLTVALNDPTKLFLNLHLTKHGGRLFYDPSLTFGEIRKKENQYCVIPTMNDLTNYKSEEDRALTFKVIKELESRVASG